MALKSSPCVLPGVPPKEIISASELLRHCRGFFERKHWSLAMPTHEIAQQMLTSPLLAKLPLLFTSGQTVWHPDLGMCTVIEAQGPRRRLVSYRSINSSCPQSAEGQVWLDVADLQEMELTMQRDLEALTPEDLIGVQMNEID